MPGEVFGFEHGGAHRWAELANRLFGMESTDAPLPAGFILELDRPEWRFLKRELLWSTGPLSVAANVAGVGRLQIQNPSTSQRLVVITSFVAIAPAAAGTYDITVDGAIIGSTAANSALDARVPLVGGTTRQVASRNAIANNLPTPSGTRVDRITAPAGVDAVSRVPPIVLIPNSLAEISAITVNIAQTFLAFGYERPVLPDELAA